MVFTPSALSVAGACRADPPIAPAVPEGAPQRSQTFTTLFQYSNGSIGEACHTLPASPLLESAFSAFARGTLIATTRGPVAIEDLQPGMKVLANERGPLPVFWIGSMSLRDTALAGGPPRLTRILTGALGIGRPMVDLMTGPGARIVQRSDCHSDQVLRPVHDLIDGTHVIALRPPGAVQLYHIALQRHATITAAGLALETFHPGSGFESALTRQQLAEFIALFPHIHRPSDFGDLAHPRGRLAGNTRIIA